ncbi:MAG: carboxypeptidase regulatory-like domain-containing protein [Actinobacteria bacterium]|nr:carboxypeptidase regulatory-like domain-containing protein [Actinomycetota bacterium]
MLYIKKITKKTSKFIEKLTVHRKILISSQTQLQRKRKLLTGIISITILLNTIIGLGPLASRANSFQKNKAVSLKTAYISSSNKSRQSFVQYAPDYQSFTTGVIYGKVVDVLGRVISGTAVRIGGTIIPTNTIGEFRFTLLVPNVYTIYYDAPGYISQTQERITVTAGNTTISPTVIMSPINNFSNSNLVFFDYFDRPNGLLADHYGNSDPLNKWEVTSQSFYAKDGRGWTNSPVFRAISKDSRFSNFTLQAKMMKMNQGNDPWEGLQLFVRYQDSDNLYAVGLRNDNTIHIKKKVSGVYTTIGQAPLNTNRLGYWYNVKVIAIEERIQVFVDEVKYLDVQDSSFSEGKVGIRTDNIEAYFDDFIVTQ